MDQHIISVLNQGDALTEFSLDTLSEFYKRAKHEYHIGNQPLLSDALFDILEDYLKEHLENQQIIDEIGALPEYGKKVKLPSHAGSQDKIYPKNHEKIPPCVMFTYSDKVDGLSGIFIPNHLYSRGNGTHGTDWSFAIPYLKIPRIPNNYVIRGEITMLNSVFHKHYAKEFVSSRNVVCGIMNRKTPNKSDLKRLSFIAYEIIEPRLRVEEQFQKLSLLGFSTPNPMPIQNTGSSEEFVQQLENVYKERRTNAEYDIDGLVVVCNDEVYSSNTDGNPSYSFAFKTQNVLESKQTEIISIEWQISKDGYLKPVGVITPVIINGFTNKRVTLKNAANVRDLGLGPGAKINIIRSGLVIPEIQSVIKKVKPSYPDQEFKWTDTNVDILLVDKENSPDVAISQLVKFCKTIECDGLGRGNITKIVKEGITTIPQIINADLEAIDGIGSKLAKQIKSNLIQAIQNASISKLMAAVPNAPRGFQLKVMDKIVEAIPNVLNANVKNKEIENILEGIPGFGEKKITSFINAIKDVRNDVKELQQWTTKKTTTTVKKKSKKMKSVQQIFANKYFIFSGVRDKNIEEEIRKRGGTIINGFSKKNMNNTILIVKTIEAGSSKIKMAKKNDVPIYDMNTFVEEQIIST